jgi:hypothetical protein
MECYENSWIPRVIQNYRPYYWLHRNYGSFFLFSLLFHRREPICAVHRTALTLHNTRPSPPTTLCSPRCTHSLQPLLLAAASFHGVTVVCVASFSALPRPRDSFPGAASVHAASFPNTVVASRFLPGAAAVRLARPHLASVVCFWLSFLQEGGDEEELRLMGCNWLAFGLARSIRHGALSNNFSSTSRIPNPPWELLHSGSGALDLVVQM